MDRPGANVDWCRVMGGFFRICDGVQPSRRRHHGSGRSKSGRRPCEPAFPVDAHAEEGDPINDALELATEAHGALDR
jgi:hypothetical protein